MLLPPTGMHPTWLMQPLAGPILCFSGSTQTLCQQNQGDLQHWTREQLPPCTLGMLSQKRTEEEREATGSPEHAWKTQPQNPRKPKLPEQSPRRTHLHVGVACPALLAHQPFCFHDWKGNKTVKSQSSRESIFIHCSALSDGVSHPRGAEPASYPIRIWHTAPQQPGPTGHQQPGEGIYCIFCL